MNESTNECIVPPSLHSSVGASQLFKMAKTRKTRKTWKGKQQRGITSRWLLQCQAILEGLVGRGVRRVDVVKEIDVGALTVEYIAMQLAHVG